MFLIFRVAWSMVDEPSALVRLSRLMNYIIFILYYIIFITFRVAWSMVGEPSALVRLSTNCDSVTVAPKFCRVTHPSHLSESLI